MANLDETPMPSGDGSPAESCDSTSLEQRLKELERENARLRSELAESREDARSFWRTLQIVAPESAITEAQMLEEMANPVPLRDALVDLERLLGAAHGD